MIQFGLNFNRNREGLDEKGKFKKGNKLSRGRPRGSSIKRPLKHVLKALLYKECLSKDKITEIYDVSRNTLLAWIRFYNLKWENLDENYFPNKRCTNCSEIKPATIEFFHKSKTGSFGLGSKCRTCLNKSELPLYYGSRHTPDGKKRCSQCKQYKHLDQFKKNNRTKDNLDCQCNECRKKKRIKAKEDGVCTTCFKNKANAGFCNCGECLEKSREKQRKLSDRKPKNHCEWCKAIIPWGQWICRKCNWNKDLRKNKGYCILPSCKNKSVDYMICKQCRKKLRINSSRFNKKRRNQQKQERIERAKKNSICTKCLKGFSKFHPKPYSISCLEFKKLQNKIRYLSLKHLAYEGYGGYVCNCCRFDGRLDPRMHLFFSLDHINNDGKENRQMGEPQGSDLYKFLLQNNFPSGFQVLCWDCQAGKARNNGICPHKYKQFSEININGILEKLKIDSKITLSNQIDKLLVRFHGYQLLHRLNLSDNEKDRIDDLPDDFKDMIDKVNIERIEIDRNTTDYCLNCNRLLVWGREPYCNGDICFYNEKRKQNL